MWRERSASVGLQRSVLNVMVELNMQQLDSFFRSVDKIATISDEERSALVPMLHYCEYSRNQVILSEGQVENHVYFLVEGIVRNYCLKDGDDISLDFFFPGDFTNSYMSFLTRQKSTVTVEALSNTRAIRIRYDDLQQLYKSSITFNKIGRVISEQLYIKRTMRELSFITMSAGERYEDLSNRHPELIQSIPQKYLSTFLGVSPETLSRLRNSRRSIA